jgi:type IV pilus assembly protein PilC
MAQAAKEAPYTWEGTDQKGNRITGKTIGKSEAEVKVKLRKQGVNVLKVKKVSTLLAGLTGGGPPVTAADISFFSRQLATMMSSGIPMVQSFEIIGKGHEKKSMQELVMTIKGDVEAGNSLAVALSKHPLIFDDLFVNLVDAGEQSGALESLLDRIATYKEKTEAMKAKIKKALTYPISVLVIAVIVTTVLLIFVIPQFESMFSNFGAELPAFTQIVVDMSRWLRANGFMAAMGIAAPFVAFAQAHKRFRKFREFVDRMSLKLPIVGEILTKSSIARFARTLQTMFAAGVPLVEALESVAGACGTIVYEQATLEIQTKVATGQMLNLAMEQTGVFPNMAIQMIGIGEESGNIDAMSGKVADFFEEEVDNMVDNLSSLMEPIIMAVLGVLVGGLVVAMYLPIFKMGSVV